MAGSQARVAAEAAAHQFPCMRHSTWTWPRCRAVLVLPAVDARLADALVRFQATVELGGGVAPWTTRDGPDPCSPRAAPAKQVPP